MGKLIAVTSDSVLYVKPMVVPFLEKYYADNDSNFVSSAGDLTLVAYMSEKPNLISQLNNVRGAANVIINIVQNTIPVSMEVELDPMISAKHMSDQIKSIAAGKWPFNIIIHAKRLPEAAMFLADLTLDHTLAGIIVKRLSPRYFKAYMGNELTKKSKKVITEATLGLDRDGDIFRGGFIDKSTHTYPIGIHPYLIESETVGDIIHVPDEGTHISERDIKALWAGDEDTYCRLVDEHIRLHPDWAQEIYENAPISVTIDKGISLINRPAVEECDTFDNIDELGPGLYKFDEVLHPYTLNLLVSKMTDHQSIVIDDKDYSKRSLELLLLYSPHFFNRQLDRFLASISPHCKEYWEQCYH